MKLMGDMGKIEVAGDTDPGFDVTLLITDENIYVTSKNY
jgi:hypothetical protein